MNKFYKEWLDKEKKLWNRSIFKIKEIENGVAVIDEKNGDFYETITWNEHLYEFIKNQIKNNLYLYTFNYENESNRNMYIQFKCDDHLGLDCSLCFIYDKEKCYFNKHVEFTKTSDEESVDIKEIETHFLIEIDKIVQRMYDYITKIPIYRLKIAIKELDSPFDINEICLIREELQKRNVSLC